MILEGGVIRTMDAALGRVGALAIAGDRVAGGVGTHELALPTPDHVDLRGRCVLPAFTDSHVHFPSWSLAQRDIQLEGAGSARQRRWTGCVPGPAPERGCAAEAGVMPTGRSRRRPPRSTR